MPESKVPELLEGALKFGIKPGLERISTLMSLLGDPQDTFKSVHIAGTNGKGSVAAFISSIMAADDKKVGVFTSPYLERFSERIRLIDGREGLMKYVADDSYGEIDDESLEKYSDQVKQARDKMVSEGLADEPTEFELITAICFLYFAEKASMSQSLRRASAEGSIRLTLSKILLLPSLRRSVLITAESWGAQYQRSQERRQESLRKDLLRYALILIS